MSMKAFWEDRYTEEIYAYGNEPNAYFKQIIDTLLPVKYYLPQRGKEEMPSMQPP